ncbi:GntR family transcriptional regulator [Streptomyces antimycoticus]|uniref:GntR family transcriptional regulator n=1 Tax=Streptomyces antimycoticus TaxID=68175 RepID=UPI0034191212
MVDQPKHARIAEEIRRQIRDGELVEGARLPAVREWAAELGVAVGTLRQAQSWLELEGLIRTSPRGTFVSDNPPTASSSYDRLLRLRRTGSILGIGETKTVQSAALVVPPLYVQEIFDLERGDQLVRREYVTGKGSRRTSFTVTWHPAHFAAAVPDLLSTAPRKSDDALRQVEENLGRAVKYAHDGTEARDASQREAAALGIAIGAPVLAHVHEWSDDEGLIEYGEQVLPPRTVIGYEYRL